MFTGRTAGREQATNIRKDNKITYRSDTCINSFVVNPVLTAPGLSQKNDISPGVSGCYQESKLKYVKNIFCVDQLSFVKPVTNVPTVASNLPLAARLQNFWQTWLDLCVGPKVVQILREGYSLPFQTCVTPVDKGSL